MPLLPNMVSETSDTRDLISMVTFTFATRRHLIRLASAPFILPPVWQRLVGFGLSSATPDNEAECRIYEGWVRTPILF